MAMYSRQAPAIPPRSQDRARASARLDVSSKNHEGHDIDFIAPGDAIPAAGAGSAPGYAPSAASEGEPEQEPTAAAAAHTGPLPSSMPATVPDTDAPAESAPGVAAAAPSEVAGKPQAIATSHQVDTYDLTTEGGTGSVNSASGLPSAVPTSIPTNDQPSAEESQPLCASNNQDGFVEEHLPPPDARVPSGTDQATEYPAMSQTEMVSQPTMEQDSVNPQVYEQLPGEESSFTSHTPFHTGPQDTQEAEAPRQAPLAASQESAFPTAPYEPLRPRRPSPKSVTRSLRFSPSMPSMRMRESPFVGHTMSSWGTSVPIASALDPVAPLDTPQQLFSQAPASQAQAPSSAAVSPGMTQQEHRNPQKLSIRSSRATLTNNGARFVPEDGVPPYAEGVQMRVRNAASTASLSSAAKSGDLAEQRAARVPEGTYTIYAPEPPSLVRKVPRQPRSQMNASSMSLASVEPDAQAPSSIPPSASMPLSLVTNSSDGRESVVAAQAHARESVPPHDSDAFHSNTAPYAHQHAAPLNEDLHVTHEPVSMPASVDTASQKVPFDAPSSSDGEQAAKRQAPPPEGGVANDVLSQSAPHSYPAELTSDMGKVQPHVQQGYNEGLGFGTSGHGSGAFYDPNMYQPWAPSGTGTNSQMRGSSSMPLMSTYAQPQLNAAMPMPTSPTWNAPPSTMNYAGAPYGQPMGTMMSPSGMMVSVPPQPPMPQPGAPGAMGMRPPFAGTGYMVPSTSAPSLLDSQSAFMGGGPMRPPMPPSGAPGAMEPRPGMMGPGFKGPVSPPGAQNGPGSSDLRMGQRGSDSLHPPNSAPPGKSASERKTPSRLSFSKADSSSKNGGAPRQESPKKRDLFCFIKRSSKRDSNKGVKDSKTAGKNQDAPSANATDPSQIETPPMSLPQANARPLLPETQPLNIGPAGRRHSDMASTMYASAPSPSFAQGMSNPVMQGAPMGMTIRPPMPTPMGPSMSSPMGSPVGSPLVSPMGPPMGPAMARPIAPVMRPPTGFPVGSPMGPPMGPPMGQAMGRPMGPPVAPPMGPPMGPTVGPPMGHPMARPMAPPTRPPMEASTRAPTGPTANSLMATGDAAKQPPAADIPTHAASAAPNTPAHTRDSPEFKRIEVIKVTPPNVKEARRSFGYSSEPPKPPTADPSSIFNPVEPTTEAPSGPQVVPPALPPRRSPPLHKRPDHDAAAQTPANAPPPADTVDSALASERTPKATPTKLPSHHGQDWGVPDGPSAPWAVSESTWPHENQDESLLADVDTVEPVTSLPIGTSEPTSVKPSSVATDGLSSISAPTEKMATPPEFPSNLPAVDTAEEAPMTGHDTLEPDEMSTRAAEPIKNQSHEPTLRDLSEQGIVPERTHQDAASVKQTVMNEPEMVSAPHVPVPVDLTGKESAPFTTNAPETEHVSEPSGLSANTHVPVHPAPGEKDVTVLPATQHGDVPLHKTVPEPVSVQDSVVQPGPSGVPVPESLAIHDTVAETALIDETVVPTTTMEDSATEAPVPPTKLELESEPEPEPVPGERKALPLDSQIPPPLPEKSVQNSQPVQETVPVDTLATEALESEPLPKATHDAEAAVSESLPSATQESANDVHPAQTQPPEPLHSLEHVSEPVPEHELATETLPDQEPLSDLLRSSSHADDTNTTATAAAAGVAGAALGAAAAATAAVADSMPSKEEARIDTLSSVPPETEARDQVTLPESESQEKDPHMLDAPASSAAPAESGSKSTSPVGQTPVHVVVPISSEARSSSAASSTGIVPGSSGPSGASEPEIPLIQAPISLEHAMSMVKPCLIIEYCDRCRWLHRATWLQTELLLTFSEKAFLDDSCSQASGGGFIASTLLIPHATTDTAGQFRVWIVKSEGTRESTEVILIWDRKTRRGFPELRELKNLIRDRVAPKQNLGHSELP